MYTHKATRLPWGQPNRTRKHNLVANIRAEPKELKKQGTNLNSPTILYMTAWSSKQINSNNLERKINNSINKKPQH